MDNAMQLHKLRYQVIPGIYPIEGQIVAGETVLLHIKDMSGFYRALGYTENVQRNGLTAEEFFWEEYRKDNGKFRPNCLSARIIKYLLTFSPTFMTDHRDFLSRWAGSCLEIPLQEKLRCIDCLMNPVQAGINRLP